MKKKDIILVVSLLAIFVGAYLCIDFFNLTESEFKVKIRDYSGKITFKNISDSGTFEIKNDTNEFYNKYQIKNNSVSMLESNCKDKICVNMKTIKNTGEMIVCLPHKVYISIQKNSNKEDEGGIDAIAE